MHSIESWTVAAWRITLLLIRPTGYGLEDSNMSEFDQRQYRLMLDDLNAFEAGRLSVDKLIADLEGLANVLEEKDEDWGQPFFQYWGHLEEAWASALHRGATALDEQEARVALSATGKLKSIVLERIADVGDRR